MLHLHNHTPTLSISWRGSQANTGTLRRRVWSEVVVVCFRFGLFPCRASPASFVPDGSTRPICDLNADVQGQQVTRSEPTRRPRFLANWAAPAAECQSVKMPKASSWSSIRQKASGGNNPVITSALKYVSIISGTATNHSSNWQTAFIFL